MRIQGSKNLSAVESTQLKRNTPLKVNSYKSRTLTQDQVDLVNSFDKDCFETYFKFYKKWGLQNNSRSNLVNDLLMHNISGPALSLANLRLLDNYAAQKVWACIKYRWTDNEARKIEKFNQDPDKFWSKMAYQIQKRSADDQKQLDPAWDGKEGRTRLVEYLKELFSNQQGLCSISKEPMLLEISSQRTNNNERLSNKCSPDRIDNSQGYVNGNIQLTTWWVNCWKSDLTVEEFYKRIETIKINRPMI
jgi:hypothetical protein